jgi:hypothetical protein
MGATTFYRDTGGAWIKLKGVFYRDTGGVWRKLKAIWYRDTGGVWRKVFAGITFNTYAQNVSNLSTSSGFRSCGMNFFTDGSATKSTGGATSAATDWGDPITTNLSTDNPVSYRVTLTGSVGTTYTGPTTGSWTSFAAAFSIVFQNAVTAGEGSGNFAVDFSLDGGSTIAGTVSGSWDVGRTS